MKSYGKIGEKNGRLSRQESDGNRSAVKENVNTLNVCEYSEIASVRHYVMWLCMTKSRADERWRMPSESFSLQNFPCE